MNIDDPEIERLAAEVCRLTGETSTEAVRRALQERVTRLRGRAPGPTDADRLRDVLERDVWFRVPPDQSGRMPTKAEREAILGLGDDGV